MKKLWDQPRATFILSLVLFVVFAFSLSIIRFYFSSSWVYWYLIWNLFLAGLPLVFSWLFYISSKKGIKFSIKNIVYLGLWLLFLPNSFYLVSDLVHLTESSDTWLVYDTVLFAVYALLGFIFGFLSLGIIHYRFNQRFSSKTYYLVFGSLLLSGYAIYLGRYLRWNSWDVITNPFGLIFDVSSSFIHPYEYPLAFGTTLLFFTFLSIFYVFLWQTVRYVKSTVTNNVKL